MGASSRNRSLIRLASTRQQKESRSTYPSVVHPSRRLPRRPPPQPENNESSRINFRGPFGTIPPFNLSELIPNPLLVEIVNAGRVPLLGPLPVTRLAIAGHILSILTPDDHPFAVALTAEVGDPRPLRYFLGGHAPAPICWLGRVPIRPAWALTVFWSTWNCSCSRRFLSKSATWGFSLEICIARVLFCITSSKVCSRNWCAWP